MDDTFTKLVAHFRRLPGIGPRQATRFVYHLLNRSPNERTTLANLIKDLDNDISQCASCLRHYTSYTTEGSLCELCFDHARDNSKLLIIEKDSDLTAIQKAGVYNGRYFVLGGIIPILEKEPHTRIRQDELLDRIGKDAVIDEIIIALSVHTEGDYTADYIKKLIKNTLGNRNMKVTVLGRGLSTGTELEYSDSETLKNALKNRA